MSAAAAIDSGHTVVVAHRVDLAMRVGKAIVDGQEVSDVPLVGEGGTDFILFGEGERRRIFRGIRNTRDRLATEIDQTIRIGRLFDMPRIERERQGMVVDVPLKLGSEFVILAVEVAESATAGEGRVDPVIKSSDRGR